MAPRNDLAKTWWSKQWIHALETRALRDPNRLPRGRTYARRGAVFDLEIEEGQITAQVEGSRARPYRITIGVRRFRPEEWDSLFEVIVSQVGFTADLLAGVVPHALVADAAHRGVELLPEAGDLSMNCSCPDWAVPCKHLAAVCYMTASALDVDPFQILRLRGRSRAAVETQLQAQRAAAASSDAEGRRSDELASGLWEQPCVERDLFSAIGRGATSRFDTKRSAASIETTWAAVGADRDGRLAADVADAAQRAAACLSEGRSTLASIGPLADAARRAGAVSESERVAIARRMGIAPGKLDVLAASWINAGELGVIVADEFHGRRAADWPMIDPVLCDIARQILIDSGLEVRTKPAWLSIAASKARIINDPAADRWFALEPLKRHWVVVGVAPLEEIADLAYLGDPGIEGP